jgi:hypothetical protein
MKYKMNAFGLWVDRHLQLFAINRINKRMLKHNIPICDIINTQLIDNETLIIKHELKKIFYDSMLLVVITIGMNLLC